jgi:Prp8 binding protein
LLSKHSTLPFFPSFLTFPFQVLCCALSDDATQVFTAGVGGDVKVWDTRKEAVVYTLQGHTEPITGLSLSADGAFLATNAQDNTVRTWDVRPFISAGAQRALSIYQGATHDFQRNLLRVAWSADGKRLSAGSADRLVYVWDVATHRVEYALPGHNGCVNEVAFHPTEPVILSASTDKTMYLGEIEWSK